MSNKNGAENIHWDLSDLYASPTDPALKSDTEKVIKNAGCVILSEERNQILMTKEMLRLYTR